MVDKASPRFRLPINRDIYNGYPLAVIVALTLHFLVLAALVYSGITRPPEILDIMQPPSVRALMIDENPQLRNERVQQQRVAEQREQERRAEQQRQEDLRRQREAEEAARQQREREAEAARQEALQQQREADAEAQRQRELAAEQERQRQAELDRQERERRAREEAEAQRQRELAAEQERQQREAEAAAAAAEVARTEQEMVMAYTGVIHDLIQQNWSRPPSARNGMTVVFRIQMVPTGDILDVELVQSSGDYAFDRAAETAIYRVGRFQELQGMPINMFNENFRSLLLTFRPEDLLN